MNRLFRRSYMRMTALMMSAVVLAGSMDISMLSVQAAQPCDLSEESVEAPSHEGEDPADNSMLPAAEESADGEASVGEPGLTGDRDSEEKEGQPDDADPEGNEDRSDDADSADGSDPSDDAAPSDGPEASEGTGDPDEEETAGDADQTEDGDPSQSTDPAEEGDPSQSTDQTEDEDPLEEPETTGEEPAKGSEEEEDAADTAVRNPTADGDPAPPPIKTTVTISGIALSDKVYDGKPMAYGGEFRVTAKIGEGTAQKEEDVTSSVDLSYSITGTVDDGTASGAPYSETDLNMGMPKNVGRYELLVTAATSSNSDGKYEFSGSKKYSFQITKRTVTVKAKDISIKITDPIPAASEFQYIVTGFVNSEGFAQDKEPVFSCEAAKDKEGIPGRYPILGSGGDAGSNYTISFQQGTLTILDKESVNISGIAIADKVYDGKPVVCDIKKLAATDANNKEVTGLTYSYSIVGETDDGKKYQYPETESDDNAIDTSKDTLEAGMPTDAGRYKLKVKVTSDVEGYKGIQQYNFDIAKRPVIVTALDEEINKDSSLPQFGYKVEGLLKDDGSSLEGTSEDKEILEKFIRKPVLGCNAKDTKTPGEYMIRPSGAYAGPNYLIEYRDGTLTILEQGQITITGVEVANKLYDGEPIECKLDPAATVEGQAGVLFKFTYAITGTGADGKAFLTTDIENGRPKNAGQYILQVTAVSEPAQGGTGETYRYTKEYPFTITPRPVVVKVSDLELRTEDELPQTYGYEIGGLGFLEGDGFQKGPSFLCDIENTDEPGTYPITASGADAGTNYSITYQPGTLTVIQREVEKTRKFLRVIEPGPVRNVENGTPLDQIVLPGSVTIKTRSIGAAEEAPAGDAEEEITETAQVVWERIPVDGTSYTVGNQAEQTFRLLGTVVLPPEVAGPENADGEQEPLFVKIQVTVREKWISKEPVAAPKASIASGSAVRRGTKVALSCETEGADIYYTLDDRKPPTKESNRYTYPIEINKYTTIYAFAYKEGYPDSEMVRFSYYIGTDIGGGDSDEPQVPEEDIPSDGKIPEGLWATELTEYTYTGKAIRPAVRIYDYKTRLEEKKDYTITYKNNVNAGDKNSSKAPTITITGKGNYEGKLIRNFTILPKNLGDPDIIVDDIALVHTGKAQKPAPTVLRNGKKLVKNRDYTIPEESYTEVGSRNITVTGCGNYTGSRMFEFVITDGIPMSKVKVDKIPDQVYTGKEIKPLPVVRYKGELLELNKNYTVSYDDTNKNVGTASVFIKGVKGGKFVGTRRVTFKIKAAASLSKAKVSMEFSPAEPVYTGNEITMNRVSVTVTVKDEGGNKHEVRLIQGTDYTVSYQNNVEAGKATVIFTGTGAYSGQIKKNFRIVPRQLNSMQVKVKMNSSYDYCKGGSKPEPLVTFGSKTLKLGTDYTLSYKQNNRLGQNARVTIKGKGNYGGSVDRTFTVTPRKISELKVDAADKVFQDKSNIYKTTVHVLDTNGGRLSAGKDYEKDVKYTYGTNIKVEIEGNGKETIRKTVLRKAGDPVGEKDIIPQGTTIQVTVTAAGNFYTGKVQGTFRIVPASISGAKVTIPVQTYTGKAVTLKTSDIQVEMNGAPLKDTEYEIVGYSRNINRGTAKVTIHGLGNYGGTKTVSFKIKSRKLTDQ